MQRLTPAYVRVECHASRVGPTLLLLAIAFYDIAAPAGTAGLAGATTPAA
jgi:hypothetical protein